MLMSSIFDIAWTYQYPNPQTFSKVRCQCCELRRWYHGVIAMESCRFTVPIGPRHSCTSPRLQTSAAVQRVTNSCCHQKKYIYIYPAAKRPTVKVLSSRRIVLLKRNDTSYIQILHKMDVCDETVNCVNILGCRFKLAGPLASVKMKIIGFGTQNQAAHHFPHAAKLLEARMPLLPHLAQPMTAFQVEFDLFPVVSPIHPVSLTGIVA